MNLRNMKLTVFLIILMGPGSSFSEESIAVTLGVRQSMEAQLNQMRGGMLEKLQQSILANAGTLSEQQESQVRKVVEEFSDNFYELYDLDALAESWEQSFRSNLSDTELREILAFYKSDIGQKSTNAMSSANLAVAHDLSVKFNQHGPVLMNQYVSKLRAAIQCCTKD